MLKLRGKKIFTIIRSKNLFIKTYDLPQFSFLFDSFNEKLPPSTVSLVTHHLSKQFLPVHHSLLSSYSLRLKYRKSSKILTLSSYCKVLIIRYFYSQNAFLNSILKLSFTENTKLSTLKLQ